MCIAWEVVISTCKYSSTKITWHRGKLSLKEITGAAALYLERRESTYTTGLCSLLGWVLRSFPQNFTLQHLSVSTGMVWMGTSAKREAGCKCHEVKGAKLIGEMQPYSFLLDLLGDWDFLCKGSGWAYSVLTKEFIIPLFAPSCIEFIIGGIGNLGR